MFSLALLPLFVWLTRRVGAERRKITRRQQETMADMSTLVEESLSVSGILLGKTMGRAGALAERFDGESRNARRPRGALADGRALGDGDDPDLVRRRCRALIYCSPASSLGTRSRSAPSSPSRRCRRACCPPIGSLLSVGVDVQSSLALFDRIFEYLDLPVDIVEPGDPASCDGQRARRGHASTTSGSATASDAPWTLHGSLVEVAGRHDAAIVGETGSGKTTLGYLVARLYDAERGAVRDRRRRRARG